MLGRFAAVVTDDAALDALLLELLVESAVVAGPPQPETRRLERTAAPRIDFLNC
jgi:hypothetical protein